ncbi:MAG: hypothetical protein ABEH65_11015 [Halobacteriales archaeon]
MSLKAKCAKCQFKAPAESDEWETVEHTSLGTLTRCPECGSTDIHSRD